MTNNTKTPLFIVRSSSTAWSLCGPDGSSLMIGSEGGVATTRRAVIDEIDRRMAADPHYTYPGRQITDDVMFAWQVKARKSSTPPTRDDMIAAGRDLMDNKDNATLVMYVPGIGENRFSVYVKGEEVGTVFLHDDEWLAHAVIGRFTDTCYVGAYPTRAKAARALITRHMKDLPHTYGKNAAQ